MSDRNPTVLHSIFITRQPAVACAPPHKKELKYDPCDKSADMRPERYASDVCASCKHQGATEDLSQDPEKKIGDGRQLKEKWKDENRNEDHHPRERKEEEVCPEHTSYCSRSAHRWKNRIWIRKPMDKSGGETRKQIEDQESDWSHTVFNVVTENPERPHVRNDVHPTTVQKHAGEEWPVVINRETDPLRPIGMAEPRRNDSEKVKQLLKLMRRQCQFEKEHKAVGENQEPCCNRRILCRNRVTYWKHVASTVGQNGLTQR